MVCSEANVRNAEYIIPPESPKNMQQSNKEGKNEKMEKINIQNGNKLAVSPCKKRLLWCALSWIVMLYDRLVFNLFIQANEVFSLIVFTWITTIVPVARFHIHIFSPIYNVIIAIIVTERGGWKLFTVGMCVWSSAVSILHSAHEDKNIWASNVRNINLCVYKEQQMLNLKSYHHRHHNSMASAFSSFHLYPSANMKRW